MKKILSIFAFGLVFICMAVFAGCEPTNSSFSLSFNDARLELLITDEYKEFSFVVGDYNSKDIDFDFSFESSIVREVADKTSYLSDGKFTFRLQPLAIGETKLTLTIRGTDVSLSIPVVVGEEIKGITAKDNVYIKRGSSRVMTSADFIFNPEYTTQTGLLYRLQNEDELALKGITWNSSTATLSVAQTSNDVNEVNIVATSVISSDITTTLVVKIVDAIDVNKLNLEVFATNYSGDSEEGLDASTRVVLYSKDVIEPKNLDFTINDVLDFKKQISVKIDDYSKYSIDVSVDGAISGDVCENAPIRAKQNNFTFDVQTDRITNKGEIFGINIKVYQTDFVSNYQQITIPVTSKMVPKTIRINGQDELCYINLYDNNTKTKTIKYSIYPNIDSSYNNDNYIMQFKLYRTTSKTSVSDDDLTNFYNFSDFLNIIFNDNDLSGLTNEADEYLANVSQNENTFVISAKRALESNLVIKATCIDKTTGEEICSNMAFIKVYQGSRSFYIDSTKYVDNTLYVKMPDIGEGSTTYSFDDFELEGGTVGRLYVTPKFSTMLSCDVSVDLLAEKPTLRITPRSVGKSDFIISTENELPPITISIVVYREITKDDFSLTVLNTDSRNLYDYSIKEQTNSIEHFSVKGKGVSINIKERIKDYTDTNKDSYGYSISLKNNSCFGLMENSNGGYTITSNNFTQNAEIVKVSLITYSSEGFIRTANEEIINVFDFNISCIDYVKDMNLTTSRDELDSNSDIAKKLKTIDVYNYNDLSYANKNLATARLYLDVQMSDNDNVVCTRKDLETNEIGFYVEQSDGEGSMLTLSSTLKLTKITEDCYKVGDVGNLYISQETDYFIAYFICDYSGINVVSDFMFTATIEDRIGYSYTASVSVNIKKYVDVDGLFLVNAMEYMYLDNTETNRQLTLNTYILPANAMLKDIVVRIEYDDADSTNCLSYTINDTKVTFTYLKGGTGTVRIFAVSRMKTNSERDEFGAYYYNIALKFNCADGTSEKKALRLLSYEDLLRFDANNHYYLDTLIDCRGNEVYFPELKNSIRGTFLQKDDENFGNDEQTGGIINFVVANKGLSSGLFGTIKDTAKIYNLVISGNFKSGDFKGMNQTSDIGLLAGTNKGTISNVQVSLSNSANNTLQISKSEQATGTVFISFGMLAGANYGTIEINNDAKISTLFVDMSNIPLRIEVSGISDVSVGGVVGKNVEGGNIFNNYLTDSYSSIGLFGINAHVNITANVGYLGAIVGSNTGGTVSSIKAQGIVRNNNSADNSYVGGILGFMDGGTLEKCTSRVYVRGAKYASGLIGHINAGIVKDNTVQATDGGEKRGIEATLVYAYGENVNAYGLTDDDTKLGEENHAYTYMLFSRTVRVIGTEEMVNQSLSIDYYYGDILVLDANETTIKVKKDMEDGSEQISMQSVSLAPLVLSAYKKAKNPSQQSILLNDIDTETLLLLAGVSLSEMSLNIDNTSLAMLKNYGRYISVNGTGVIQLKASSSLNYKAYALITIYLIEYFEEITAYLDRGMSNAVGELKLVNQNTTAVYMRGYTHNYKYKNTLIELEDNQQLEYVIITEDDIIDIESNGYIAYFTAKASINTKSTNIVVKPIIKIGNNEYYGKYVQGLGVNVFLSNIDEDKQIATRFSAKVLTGIQNIKSDKNTIMAEPSDNVSFNVSYTTYNENDNLSAEAFIVFGNNSSEILASSYNEEDGSYTFIKSNGPLFVLQKDIAQSIDLGGEIYQVVQSYNVYATLSYSAYNTLKNSTIKIRFYSEMTSEEMWLSIEYSPETITAVLINNYSYEENNTMKEVTGSASRFKDEEMLNTSQYSSIGEQNILKAYVYTKYSEFDYVEVIMNLSQAGGYMAPAKEYQDGGKKIYKASYDYSVVKNDTNLILRIYREDLIENKNDFYDNEERTLCITIIYSLPASYLEGARAEIDYMFYKFDGNDAVNIYTKSTSVIAKGTNKVEFTIYGRESMPVDEVGYNIMYNVAKGKSYALELNVSGFTDEEIIFESTNVNVASIENRGGVYYLIISDVNIPYANAEYYVVSIASYGKKTTGSIVYTSVKYCVKLCIYELLIENELFDEDTLSFRLLENIDVRETISGLLQIEYQSTVIRDNFIKSFKDNSSFFIVNNNSKMVFGEANTVGTDYEINGYKFKPTALTEKADYQLGVTYEYAYVNGTPTCNKTLFTDHTVHRGTILFNIRVYFNSSEKMPLPISNVEELYQVQDDEYYRLVSDIVINSEDFRPLDKTPKSFDGNGYKIIIKGTSLGVNLSDIDQYGLFKEIKQGAVVKNLKVVLNNQLTLRIENHNVSNALIGIICATNNGSITNCEVISENNFVVNLITSSLNMENSYFGGIVALNNGFITNSRMLANITVSGASVGGFVANNNGKISSSYIKNVKIANKSGSTNENIVTGGFVCNNYGEISMSYIEGKQSTNYIFCTYNEGDYSLQSKIIDTSSASAGFVYNNYGVVLDSYSNIPVSSSSKAAGFVGINVGQIKRVYSLSKMESNNTIKSAFVITYDESAVFEDCYFAIQKEVINYGTSESNYILDGGNYKSKITNVKPLSLKEFSSYDSVFANFLVSDNKNNPINGVWFYVKNSESEIVTDNSKPYSLSANGFEVYDVDSEIPVEQKFVSNRLQLVSANIIATSRYTLDWDKNYRADSNGYVYTSSSTLLLPGTAKNPYLIAEASDLEQYLAQNLKNKKEYYRLICDIDYISEGIYSSSLFNRTLIAYFEGNNLSISNYAINSSIAYASGGYFGTIGSTVAEQSVIKNVNLHPYYINLPNCNFVGGLAGTLANACIYNISVDNENTVIVGNNIVGGLFGRTIGANYLRNIYSNMSVRSTRYSSEVLENKDKPSKIMQTALYQEKENRKSTVSYAGAIAGYIGGITEAKDISVGKSAKVFGVICGLLFGGIGSFASVDGVQLNMNSYENMVSALAFGGMLTGENSGTISNIDISSNIVLKNLFNVETVMPVAVGGIAGIMLAGEINNVRSDTGYSVMGAAFSGRYGFKAEGATKNGCAYDNILNPYVVKYVGGVVGYAKSGTIKNISIGQMKKDNDGIDTSEVETGLIITGGNYVGGIIGLVETNKNSDVELIDIKINFVSHKKYVHENGNEFDEFFYAQFVSEAGYNSTVNMIFDEQIFFGLFVGAAINTSSNAYRVIKISSTSGFGLIEDKVKADEIYIYYGKYIISSESAETIFPKFVGNDGLFSYADLTIKTENYDLTTGNSEVRIVKGNSVVGIVSFDNI